MLENNFSYSAMGPAPNTGILMGHVPQEGAESSKGEDFLDTHIQPPLKASHHHQSRFTVGGPWVEGVGWDERGGKDLHYNNRPTLFAL